jgi:quinolinate synthase
MRERILALKRERNATILAHNYQLPEIQEIADFVGDSLELAIRAKETHAGTIIFCGVTFMAETAKILNPDRTVILPVKEAGCPLADQLTPAMLEAAKREHPGAAVAVYVNSTAECKAAADITCTSANAVAVVRSLAAGTVIFGPDANLADYVQRRVPEKTIIPVPPTGHCHVHTVFTDEDIAEARRRGSIVICHPECPRPIREQADLIASTGGMVREAASGDRWTVLTEKEMGYRLQSLYPDKTFFVREDAICHDMKLTTLETLLHALETGEYEIVLDRDLMDRARVAIERMIAVRG